MRDRVANWVVAVSGVLTAILEVVRYIQGR
jgi:hypothetical protein